MGLGEQSDSHRIDTRTPSVARMYDWLLGGVDNYRSDRDACADLLRIVPDSQALALNNRAFLRRIVHYLAAERGIRQFLDHGSGLPTRDNVHEIAQREDPDSRVVYIDNDPIVHAHARARLEHNDRTAVLHADMTETTAIFGHPDVRRLIRRHQPTAALFVSVAHCLKDEQVLPMFRRVKDRLAPGSVMVICQLVSERADIRDQVTALMKNATDGAWGRVRSKAEVAEYFDQLGLTAIKPGLVNVTTWGAESDVVPRQRTGDWEEWGGAAVLS
ncbi:SAM-dependent methyltransferase [Streptomyces uncialis]|uniref:SAM-dependent methyltransferase n=1 Tax=Streptomyces uncialis TaxID=1048205 RepID=UPI00225965AE|nr:SAM-dependent methyltransferase [Streptomyces uncialis]MCX4659141.1 SAM-dependent methyltransferase [Streptomyces uncialis]